MRNSRSIFLVLFASIFIGTIVGCETEKIIFDGPYFVRFTKAADTGKESDSKTIKIEIHNAGPAPKSNVNITYSITGDAREGVDYVILGTRGQTRIRSGDLFGYIEIQLINNANNILRSQNVTFTLLSVDHDDLHVGQGESAIGTTFTYTIVDDCILGGSYYGLRTGTSGTPAPVDGITITSNDCETYILSNWDVEIFQFPSIRDLTFIDNDDNTLTIPQQEDDTLPQDAATIDGFGAWDPTTRELTFTVRLVDQDGQPEFSFKLIPN